VAGLEVEKTNSVPIPASMSANQKSTLKEMAKKSEGE